MVNRIRTIVFVHLNLLACGYVMLYDMLNSTVFFSDWPHGGG